MSDTDEIKKIYWSIGEIAAQLNCATSRIRFWCKEFGIDPKRGHHFNRKFMAPDVEALLTVQHLLEVEGYTIKGAKRRWQQLQPAIYA